MMPIGRHEAVDHDKMFAKPAKGNKASVHCNTAEGDFSIVKRGIVGTFHHVSPALFAALFERVRFPHERPKKLGFDDATRAAMIVKGATGKRLTYIDR
jgi:hypothetical protein